MDCQPWPTLNVLRPTGDECDSSTGQAWKIMKWNSNGKLATNNLLCRASPDGDWRDRLIEMLYQASLRCKTNVIGSNHTLKTHGRSSLAPRGWAMVLGE